MTFFVKVVFGHLKVIVIDDTENETITGSLGANG